MWWTFQGKSQPQSLSPIPSLGLLVLAWHIFWLWAAWHTLKSDVALNLGSAMKKWRDLMLHDLYLACVEGRVYGRTFFIGMIRGCDEAACVSTLHDPGKVDKEKEVGIFSWTLLSHLSSECHTWQPVRALALSYSPVWSLTIHISKQSCWSHRVRKKSRPAVEKSDLKEQISTRMGLLDVLGLLWGRIPSKRIIETLYKNNENLEGKVREPFIIG